MTGHERHLPYDWFPDPVPPNVVLADDADVWSSLAFLRGTSTRPVAVRVGARSGVYSGVMFDLGPDGEVVIGDECMFGEVTFATNHRIVIGDHCLIARCTVLADDPVAVPAPTARRDPAGAPEMVISLDDNAWVGQHAILLPGAHIGTGAVVGMKTIVDFPVAPYAIVAGSPPRVIGDTRDAR